MVNSKELPELFLDSLTATSKRWSPRHAHERRDLYSADNYQSYLVDSSGNEYDPYSLAWRYLGLYIDCDISNSTNFYQYYSYNNRRLPEENNNNDGECERKLLWAAYVDQRYRGNTIEEYSFYDIKNGTYDESTCEASGNSHRCVRMDCHESHTHFKLVGVFKESQGMYDWTEQLFKHEGYCIWQGDEDDPYETMETWMEKWPQSCKQLSMPDYYGNTIYIDVHPLPEGNMTLEIYTDNQCTMLSDDMNLEAYIYNLYNYYGYGNRGKQIAQQYAEAIDTWNEKMSVFKVCQPCRAYNLYYNQNNKNSHDHRFLENDGDGEEQERYNCYDDAGYTNVNQCYKFETKTQLEPAYDADLQLADAQGTLLQITANGRTYGKGGYSTPFIGNWNLDLLGSWNLGLDVDLTAEQMMYLSFGSIVVVWIGMLFFFHRRHVKKCKEIPREMGDSLYETEYDSDDSDDSSRYSRRSDYSRSSDKYSPPTIELVDTVEYAPKAGCCASQPEVIYDEHVKSFASTVGDIEETNCNSSIDMSTNYYSPPTIEPVDTIDYSSNAGCCASKPEVMYGAYVKSFESTVGDVEDGNYVSSVECTNTAEDDKSKQISEPDRTFESEQTSKNSIIIHSRFNPTSESDANTFETEQDYECRIDLHADSAVTFESKHDGIAIQSRFIPTPSEMESMDSVQDPSIDQSIFNTTVSESETEQDSQCGIVLHSYESSASISEIDNLQGPNAIQSRSKSESETQQDSERGLGASFDTEHDGIIQSKYSSAVSEMESMNDEDRSHYKTRSNSTTYIGNINSNTDTRSFDSEQSKPYEGPQPDIVGMNQSDMSSFESINDRTRRLERWKFQQQELAHQAPAIQELKQLQPSTLEKVQEGDSLSDALLRVQQRIIKNQHDEQESSENLSNVNSSSKGNDCMLADI